MSITGIPQKGKMMDCPACGKNVEQRDIYTGKHQRVCQPFVEALKDAQPGTVQKRHRQQIRQDELVRRTETFSERWADTVLDAPFVRRHWGWMILALPSLAFLVGLDLPSNWLPYQYISIWIINAAIPFILTFLLTSKRLKSLTRRLRGRSTPEGIAVEH